MTKLKTEIEKFRTWALQYPESERYGEWECDYLEWTSIYIAFEHFLLETNFCEWNEAAKREILYIIARDNEMENLVTELAKDTSRLLSIAQFAIQEAERDAKWQLAVELGKVQTQSAQAEEHLLSFVRDADEYVRRRALMALASSGLCI
jgi:hypothetical protein